MLCRRGELKGRLLLNMVFPFQKWSPQLPARDKPTSRGYLFQQDDIATYSTPFMPSKAGKLFCLGILTSSIDPVKPGVFCSQTRRFLFSVSQCRIQETGRHFGRWHAHQTASQLPRVFDSVWHLSKTLKYPQLLVVEESIEVRTKTICLTVLRVEKGILPNFRRLYNL